MSKKIYSFNLDEESMVKIKAIAEANGRSISSEINLILKKEVAKKVK
jgi:hypothetical protein